MSTLRFAAVNADGLLADLDLPPAAYRALLKLRALSEPGGRIHIDQATIGHQLSLSRPSVNAALRTLELARLVKKVRNGLYQINPMLAGYNSPEDAVAAVHTMPAEDRLDTRDFLPNYHQAVAAYENHLVEKRRRQQDLKRRQALKAVS
ncbi:MarR family transcriptional regulator [Streptomyces sp. NPDC001480]|uniref:MarR family transcriptional regulator n=1 Tax=Streptomyces sp. NPDC001480 TaxID=3364577 RepID=UPI00369EEDA4